MGVPPLNRRVLLASAAAVAIPALPAITPPAPHPDAALLEACRRYPLTMAAFNTSLVEFDDDADDPLWNTYLDTRTAIDEAAPATIAGIVAKCRAAKAEARRPDGSEFVPDGRYGRWAWDIVNDLLRLYGGEG